MIMTTSEVYQRIYRVVERIPAGKVATYGQIATLAGLPGRARQVGYALHTLSDDSPIPWHRVVNAHGDVSLRSEPDAEIRQRVLLEEEGILCSNKTLLKDHQWAPKPDELE